MFTYRFAQQGKGLVGSAYSREPKISELFHTGAKSFLPQNLVAGGTIVHPSTWAGTAMSDAEYAEALKKYKQWMSYRDAAVHDVYNFAAKDPKGHGKVERKYADAKAELTAQYEAAKKAAINGGTPLDQHLDNMNKGSDVARFKYDANSTMPTDDATMQKYIEREARYRAIKDATMPELEQAASLKTSTSNAANQVKRKMLGSLGAMTTPWEKGNFRIATGLNPNPGKMAEFQKNMTKTINEVVIPHLQHNKYAYGAGAAVVGAGAIGYKLLAGQKHDMNTPMYARSINPAIYPDQKMPHKYSDYLNSYRFEQVSEDSVHTDKPLKNFSVKVSQGKVHINRSKGPVAAAPAINMHPDEKEDSGESREDIRRVKKLTEGGFVRTIIKNAAEDAMKYPVRTGAAVTAATVTPVIAYKALKENTDYHKKAIRQREKDYRKEHGGKMKYSEYLQDRPLHFSELFFEEGEEKKNFKQRRSDEEKLLKNVTAGITIAHLAQAAEYLMLQKKLDLDDQAKKRNEQLLSSIANSLRDQNRSAGIPLK